MKRGKRFGLCRFFREEHGNVMVEFGFLIPFLVILAVGTVDFGRFALQKIAITNAARAATQYGTQDLSTTTDVSGMQQAARTDYGDDGNVLNVEFPHDPLSYYCTCPGSSETLESCNTLCTGGQFPYTYVQVTVWRDFETLIPYPGIETPRRISSTHTMRYR